MELTGKAIWAGQTRTGEKNGKPWAIRQYVIEFQNGNYTNHLLFDVFGEDKIKEFDIHSNDEITVSFDIDAREYQGKWFNSIRAWKVVKVTHVQQFEQAPTPQPAPKPADPFDTLPQQAPNSDSLPF